VTVKGVVTKIWGAHAPRVLARRLAERIFFVSGHRWTEDRFGEAPKPAREARALPRLRAFTVVELLIVMAIILVLAGLILATSGYAQKKGRRSKAEAEIAAISAALEDYRADHGIYPRDARTDALKSRAPDPAAYAPASLHLYDQLAGAFNGSRIPTAKSYFTFKPNQLSPTDQTRNVTFIRDPFGNSYGYSTASQLNSEDGYNPTFDLWSTANAEPAIDQSQWIKNW
jgi:prepilin-type N-terminal cleavage/methylation domain-containing protein